MRCTGGAAVIDLGGKRFSRETITTKFDKTPEKLRLMGGDGLQ
jgi:hypothetical protein